jgi:hypothetical protein
MSRLAVALTILVVTLAACGATVAQPSPAPSEAPASPSAPPSASPPPAPVQLSVEERYLLDGIRRGAIDCRPVRDKLPIHSVGGIECRSDDPAVAKIGFYLFDGDADMLDAYFARMRAEGVEPDSGGCDDREGEAPYIPDEGLPADRHGCFVNLEGYANYRATISGNHVYIGVLGRTADMRALADFAWRGNQDVPGTLTLWGEPGQ